MNCKYCGAELDADMKLVPVLAESWEVKDETTTVFHLRKGVKFHDGNEMKAEDVKFSLERCIASPGVNYNYLIISEINIIDEYTVEFKTSEPCSVLPGRARTGAQPTCGMRRTLPSMP